MYSDLFNYDGFLVTDFHARKFPKRIKSAVFTVDKENTTGSYVEDERAFKRSIPDYEALKAEHWYEDGHWHLEIPIGSDALIDQTSMNKALQKLAHELQNWIIVRCPRFAEDILDLEFRMA